MPNIKLAEELVFKKDWIWDPPNELAKQIEIRDLARLATIQLRAQHAAIKIQEEAMEEAIEIYQRYAK